MRVKYEIYESGSPNFGCFNRLARSTKRTWWIWPMKVMKVDSIYRRTEVPSSCRDSPEIGWRWPFFFRPQNDDSPDLNGFLPKWSEKWHGCGCNFPWPSRNLMNLNLICHYTYWVGFDEPNIKQFQSFPLSTYDQKLHINLILYIWSYQRSQHEDPPRTGSRRNMKKLFSSKSLIHVDVNHIFQGEITDSFWDASNPQFFVRCHQPCDEIF